MVAGTKTQLAPIMPLKSNAPYPKNAKKMMDDAGEPAPEDGDIEELSYHEMLLNRESNPGLPRLVGVNDKRKS